MSGDGFATVCDSVGRPVHVRARACLLGVCVRGVLGIAFVQQLVCLPVPAMPTQQCCSLGVPINLTAVHRLLQQHCRPPFAPSCIRPMVRDPMACTCSWCAVGDGQHALPALPVSSTRVPSSLLHPCCTIQLMIVDFLAFSALAYRYC